MGTAQTPQSSRDETTFHSATSLVFVPALVVSPSKEMVFSLSADDFFLTDDGLPQKVRLDEGGSQPLALVVLMQTGGAARMEFKNFAHLDSMIPAILGNPPNQVAIVNFDSRPEADCPFTSDVAQWKDALDDPEPGDDGAAIFDGLDYALRLLKQQPPNVRRAILLVSQQHDDGSKTKLKDIIRALGESDTAVYSLTFSVEKEKTKRALTLSDPLLEKKPLTVGDKQYYAYFDLGAPLALALGAMRENLSAEVARISGGEAFDFSGKGELDRALSSIANDIHNRYLLNFTPALSQPGLHTLQVRVPSRPDARVMARTNYWASEPPH